MIVFANIPFIKYDKGQKFTGPNAGSRWPFTLPGDMYAYAPYPFYLGYAASYVAAHKFSVKFYDGVAMRRWDYGTVTRDLVAMKPDILVVEIGTPVASRCIAVAIDVKMATGCKLVFTGPHMAVYSDQLLAEGVCDYAVIGEYDAACLAIVQGSDRRKFTFEHVANIDTLPDGSNWKPMRPLAFVHEYYDPSMVTAKTQLAVNTSRGCRFKCLAGDTPVNTVEGKMPIASLVGREGLGVFTYDRKTGDAKVSTATRIQQYGTAKLIRVHFDDGSHIDCTPDHKFLQFKWGNQSVGEREWECEAKDLPAGAHVRAIKIRLSGPVGGKYPTVAWKRARTERAHRLIMEWKIGRPLVGDEQVHHINHDKMDYSPDNLQLCQNAKEHFRNYHPEIAERMRRDNPSKYCTAESHIKVGNAIRGIKRSEETKRRMSEAAYRRYTNPEQRRLASILSKGRVYSPKARDNMSLGHKRRKEKLEEIEKHKIINHRVVRVEELPGEHPVYCLTVADTGWFYANDVLVANCTYCAWPKIMENGTYRARSPEMVIDEIASCVANAKAIGIQPIGSIFFDDDTWNLGGTKRITALCEGLKGIGLPWTMMGRLDVHAPELFDVMRDAGCVGMRFGIESFAQHVLDRTNGGRIAQKQYDAIKRLVTNYRGFQFHLTSMRNMPGQTEADWLDDQAKFNELKGIAAASGSKLTWQVSNAMPLPGTHLWEQMRAAGHQESLDACGTFDGMEDNHAIHDLVREFVPLTVKGKE